MYDKTVTELLPKSVRTNGEIFGELYHGEKSRNEWLYGPKERENHWTYRGYPGSVPVPGTSLLDFTALKFKDDNWPYEESTVMVALTILDVGVVGAIGKFLYVTGEPDQFDSWRQHQKVFRGTAAGPYVPDMHDGDHATIVARSEAGQIALSYPLPGNSNTIGEAKVWLTSGDLSSLGVARAYAINNEGKAVGTLSGWVETNSVSHQTQRVGYEDPETLGENARGDLGFLWTPEDGLQTFHDLLPEKFKKQVRSAVPYLIGNADPTTGEFKILFTAEVLNEAGDQWISSTLRLDDDGAGNREIGVIETSGSGDVQHIAMAADGTTTGVRQGVPTIQSEIRFEPVTKPDVNRAYDPPLQGDSTPSPYGGTERVKDPKGEWWTSVGMNALTINSRIKLVFPSAAAAKKYVIRLAQDDSSKYVTLTKPTGVLGKENTLELVGKTNPDRNLNPLCKMLVLPKGADADDTKAVATLHVRALTFRDIPVKFYKVVDPDHVGLTDPGTHLPVPSIVETELNKRFEQVPLRFTVDPAIADLSLRYDNTPTNGNLDDAETDALQGWAAQNGFTAQHPPHIPILIITRTSGKSELAYFDNDGKFIALPVLQIDPEREGEPIVEDQDGASKSMSRVLAHEVGHYLGLSTRTDARAHAGDDEFHDGYPCPKGTATLMRSGSGWETFGKWMRQEDWEAAGIGAVTKFLPP